MCAHPPSFDLHTFMHSLTFFALRAVSVKGHICFGNSNCVQHVKHTHTHMVHTHTHTHTVHTHTHMTAHARTHTVHAHMLPSPHPTPYTHICTYERSQTVLVIVLIVLKLKTFLSKFKYDIYSLVLFLFLPFQSLPR